MRFLLLMAALAGLAACGSKFRHYDGPEVTSLLVDKGERRMWLFHHDQVLRSFDVGLGRNPVGHKQFEGDGRTPEGWYRIDRRNPNSEYHLSVGISYPDDGDRSFAAEAGAAPGGDIFIHGHGDRRRRGDWTEGCIAVTNREIEDIYAMVRDGTPILIRP